MPLRNRVGKETREQKRRTIGELPGREALDPEHLAANFASSPWVLKIVGKLLNLSQPRLSHLTWERYPPSNGRAEMIKPIMAQ